jgi:hypothetical protein
MSSKVIVIEKDFLVCEVLMSGGRDASFHARIYNIHVQYFTPNINLPVTPVYMQAAYPVVIIGYTISSYCSSSTNPLNKPNYSYPSAPSHTSQ